MGGPRAEFDLFLSYNRRDRQVVEPLAEALCGRGLRVFKDDWYLRPGEFWPAALEKKLGASGAVAVAVGRNGLGAWQQREAIAAIERQNRETRAGNAFPVIPVLLDEGSQDQAGLAFLLQNTWVERWDPHAPDLIAGAVRGQAPAELYGEERNDPRTRICPYRGLNVFREEDAAFYFGREEDVDALVGVVEGYRFVAVVGASGSGKSSLVRAGLFPALRRQRGERVWQALTTIPGKHPFLSLARALLPLREPVKIQEWSKGDVDDEAERLAQRLKQDGAEHLLHVVKQIMAEEPGTTHLMLVDQWEELYTYRPPERSTARTHIENVHRFTNMLLEAAHRGALRVVLTLRADFWGEVLNDQPLAARLPDEATVHLRAMDRSALEAVIRRPAEITRLALPDTLIELLLDDAFGQPGDLPLLEFALQQLWGAWGRGESVLDAYRAMGRLEGAIVSHADAVFQALDAQERPAVPGVFAALVQVGEARTDLRRRARLGELGEAGQRVARRLASARLLVTSRDPESGDDLVEVAHEALLRGWPRLDDWVRERREALLTVRQLQTDACSWLTHHKDSSYLWSHERVREAASALAQLGNEVVLNEDEREFLGPIDAQSMCRELDRPETTHPRRALIGERLAVLGDPRPGTGVGDDNIPDIAWCPVPDGEVAIEIARRFRSGTKPRWKRVAPCRIARYPITVAQYRTFMEAEDGWRDPRWWDEDLYRDPEGHTHDFGRYGNHPAVYVSWFDAVAFCRWLSQRLACEVRLPEEWEWQHAATGGHSDNAYPWGPDWDPKREPHRANTFESRLGRATAVGMYPAGAVRVGGELGATSKTDRGGENAEARAGDVLATPLDMAGTVWEWCLNKHDSLDVTASRADDFDSRVLRGGSWFGYQGGARCTHRLGDYPYDRGDGVGFRVLSSAPIFDP